jgi:hypothetical protein
MHKKDDRNGELKYLGFELRHLPLSFGRGAISLVIK